MSNDTTDFGYKTVKTTEKQQKVNEVFHSVASRYDIMNDLMSGGIHRLWKRFALSALQVRPHHTVLDVASGTGDMARAIAKKLSNAGFLVLSDINADMLKIGRDRLIDAGITKHCDYVLGNAEKLPFVDNSFDRIIISFGLRNVTDKDKALACFYQLLKPGGRLVVLEFSQPTLPWLSKLYDAYSFQVLPRLGQWIANDADSYQYLAESIRMHPAQNTLKQMMLTAGFDTAQYQNLTGGIVAVHTGHKY